MRTKAENGDGALDLAGSGSVSGHPRLGDPVTIGDLVALVVSDLAPQERLKLPSFLGKFGLRLVLSPRAVDGEGHAEDVDEDDESGQSRL